MPEVSYAPLIERMTWSYSRLTAFEDCPYRWYLKYINPPAPGGEAPLFFSSYGLFMHELLAAYYSGKSNKLELRVRYLAEFEDRVAPFAPSRTVYKGYFQSGLKCIDSLTPADKVLGVEQKALFSIGGHSFVGFIDLIEERDGTLILTDHKSHALKERSQRKTPTQSDRELDQYLRQLYLYSDYIEVKFGRPPDFLRFNCFRVGTNICEPYDPAVKKATETWVTKLIQRITRETVFPPDIEPFRCRYLCEYHQCCEYYQLYKGGEKHSYR